MSARGFSRLSRCKRDVYFQVLSDLHLELGEQYSTFQIPACAPYLILAGDIGRLCQYQVYLNFLQRHSVHFRKIFLVLGNHEFFGVSRTEGLLLAGSLEEEAVLQGRLKVLNRIRVDISEGISILGCTLQSYISPDSRAIVACKVNDFRRIQQWTVEDHNAEHSKDVAWLREQILAIRKEDMAKAHDQRAILVVTHHAPIRRGASSPEHEDSPWGDAFCTALLDASITELHCLLDVQWWIFGHTHFTTNIVQGKVNLVSNQRGYVFPRSENGEGYAPVAKTSTKGYIPHFPSWLRSPSGHSKHEFDVRRTIRV